MREILKETPVKRPLAVLYAVLLLSLKIRYVLIAAPLILFGILKRKGWLRTVLAVFVPVGAFTAALMIWNLMVYGRVLRMHRLHEIIPHPERMVKGLSGLLFDHAFGLFPIAPVYVFLALGAGLLLARRRFLALIFAVSVLPYLLLLGQKYGWWNTSWKTIHYRI